MTCRVPRRYNAEKKAGVSVGTSGSTPLHFAASNGHKRIIELLLSAGARPDLTEKRGLTPEDLAQQNGHNDVVQALRMWDRSMAAADAVTKHLGERSKLPPPDIPPGAPSPATISSVLPTSPAGEYAARMLSPQSSSSAHNAEGAPSDQVKYATYDALTLQPTHNRSSTSVSSFDKRRPSLPSAIQKAVHPGATIKQALGNIGHSKPPPLKLTDSNSDAFDSISQSQRSRRASISSTARSSIASVFGKRTSSTASLDNSRQLDALGSDTPDEPATEPLPKIHTVGTTPDRTQTDGDSRPSQDSLALQNKIGGSNNSRMPATAPPSTSNFPEHVQTLPATSQSQSTVYRPRKPSLISNTSAPLDSIEFALEQGHPQAPLQPPPLSAPISVRHSRSFSNGSGSMTSSVYSYGPGAAARAAAPNAHPDASSPPLQAAADTPSVQNGEECSSELDDLPSEEARDSFVALQPSAATGRTRSNSRLRADSIGSNTSNNSKVSAISPHAVYAVHAHSPLGSQDGSSDKLPLDNSERPALSVLTRPRRSGSASTADTDLRHIVLSSAPNNNLNTMSVSPTSPTSLSSWSGSNYLGSTASTRATSEGHIPIVRDPPASPRKMYRSDISPELAHSMVREAEQSLLSFGARKGGSQSLAQHLAAYGDRVALEKEVNRRERQKLSPASSSTRHPSTERKFTWERLDGHGNHSPLAQNQGTTLSLNNKSLPGRRLEPYQQGNLDVRRPEAPSLKRPDSQCMCFVFIASKEQELMGTCSAPRGQAQFDIPPAVDPRLALRPSGQNKPFEQRAASFTSPRTGKTPFQYTILESNHPTPQDWPADRATANSIDDPVRQTIPPSSATSATSASSPTPSLQGVRASGRSKQAGQGLASGSASHKSRRSAGDGSGTYPSPTRAPASLDEVQQPVQLQTPMAPRKAYEPASGWTGIKMQEERKGFFAKGFNKLRNGLS